MQYFVPPVARLIEAFQKLPGIGRKTAQRLAFYILAMPESTAKEFAQALLDAKEQVRMCEVCQNLTDESPCAMCSDPKRNHKIICVVESPKDVIAMDKTKDFHVVYHVLHGVLSPLDGVGPDDIRLKELLNRVTEGDVEEVIMATNPNIEGEATAAYAAKLLKPFGVKVTRIANGVPIGADLEYADEVTLSKALEGRHEM